LYKCNPIYPEEITQIIKFKVWEIQDVSPSREERYNRLQQISKLASTLEIPNIYTLTDRYAAEKRWFTFYPDAREVF
jgi:hypothetical protein